jgi:hypothetical protein
MSSDYRVERVGSRFTVIDDAGSHVDLHDSEKAALREVERCKWEDERWETAVRLVSGAIETYMQTYGVDRETASRCIRDVLGGR